MNKNNQNLYRKFKLRKVFIPQYILRQTEKHLREHGSRGHEGMVLWSGIKLKKNKAIIKSCIHPEQYCTPTSFDVSLDESQRINVLLEQKKEVIIAQVHTHPSGAFHSGTDDNFPVTFIVGLFSIVVPDFCKGKLRNLLQCRIWEHIGLGKWQEVKIDEIKKRFIISPRRRPDDY